MHVYIYICMYVCVFVYRERERESTPSPLLPSKTPRLWSRYCSKSTPSLIGHVSRPGSPLRSGTLGLACPISAAPKEAAPLVGGVRVERDHSVLSRRLRAPDRQGTKGPRCRPLDSCRVRFTLQVRVECLIGKQNKPTLFKVTEPSSVPYRTPPAPKWRRTRTPHP